MYNDNVFDEKLLCVLVMSVPVSEKYVHLVPINSLGSSEFSSDLKSAPFSDMKSKAGFRGLKSSISVKKDMAVRSKQADPASDKTMKALPYVAGAVGAAGLAALLSHNSPQDNNFSKIAVGSAGAGLAIVGILAAAGLGVGYAGGFFDKSRNLRQLLENM